jgi:hypothetical protein
MVLPTRTALGASTTNRKWGLDVQDPAAPGVWVPVMGLQESKPRPGEATTQDDSDMDGEGFKSQTVTALTWGFDGKVLRKSRVTQAQAYDPGQEIIRKAALQLGSAAVIPFRYYEMEPGGPRVEAYQGLAVPTWTPDGGNMESLDTVAISLTGRGKRNAIPHPETDAIKAVITAITPSGVVAGGTVAIRGGGFTGITGATGVKFGATNATSYIVHDDNLITAVMPAGSAGVVSVTVGVSTQTSDPVNYTRGA